MTDPISGDQTESQLEVLSEINTICATIDCKFWLRGG